MKLRNRTKRVPSNIKQEDCESDLTAAKPSAVSSTVADTFGQTIKQEDTKDHKKTWLEQDGGLDKRDYYYHCELCKKRMPNIKSVLEHRSSAHINFHGRKSSIKHINVEPNIYDPKFYCKSCEKVHRNAIRYRAHLRLVHHMVLKRLPTRNLSNNATPDPNLYCEVCDYTYARESIYRRHCRYAHGMTRFDFAHQKSISNRIMDAYCQVCDKRLASISSYRAHLFVIHKVKSGIIQQKRDDILPNVNDPNFYCCFCDKKLSSKRTFKQHLRLVHSIFQSSPRKTSRIKPIVDDPNNYCRACGKTYSSKYAYRTHLHLVHRMTQTSKRSANPTDLPDPYNPDYYCSICAFYETESLVYSQS
ncbi:C2H2-type zinc finger transcription factor [Mucor lusitanicus CBS 277.49]|uniref:C2H2-type zinc finger transcription factor n=1 Tax=Mucor lusitanicus CBS 277.49 TaxID=747725 RepID=A0A168MA54_MUCCL|nr:C2H2-type zinc finger transcription factor [Mucor lusitanicus CBS 277.49]